MTTPKPPAPECAPCKAIGPHHDGAHSFPLPSTPTGGAAGAPGEAHLPTCRCNDCNHAFYAATPTLTGTPGGAQAGAADDTCLPMFGDLPPGECDGSLTHSKDAHCPCPDDCPCWRAAPTDAGRVGVLTDAHRSTAVETARCALQHGLDVRLIGNVRAEDLADMCLALVAHVDSAVRVLDMLRALKEAHDKLVVSVGGCSNDCASWFGDDCDCGYIADVDDEALDAALSGTPAVSTQPVTPVVSAWRMDTPYPLPSVLGHLLDAVAHMFEKHDCDAHGWEVWQSALKHGREIHAALVHPVTPTGDGNRVRELEEVLRKSITRIEILMGRMRACTAHEASQAHDLSLFEAEAWVREERAALAADSGAARQEAPAAAPGGEPEWPAHCTYRDHRCLETVNVGPDEDWCISCLKEKYDATNESWSARWDDHCMHHDEKLTKAMEEARALGWMAAPAPTGEPTRAPDAAARSELDLVRAERHRETDRFQNVLVNLYSIASGGKECDPRVSIGMATSAVRSLVTAVESQRAVVARLREALEACIAQTRAEETDCVHTICDNVERIARAALRGGDTKGESDG